MPRSFQDLHAIYHLPFFELIQKGREVYCAHWPEHEIQLCKLLSIKTGGCSEDCGYCAQSAHHATGLESEKLMTPSQILPEARLAKAQGATRFCMGAAWKGIRETDPRFDMILQTVREVRELGLEACVTLGQISPEAARQLKDAGLTAYNHNIDTSPEYYEKIVSTHTFADRLKTIASVQDAGISVCSGGIIGMGETEDDRLKMLEVLARLDPPPESVPINCLQPIEGTPLAEQDPVPIFQLVRLIATARIAFPHAKVRLSAGRTNLTKEGQALCFFAGANAIFFGDKLLTASNPSCDEDQNLLAELDLRPLAPL
jgi:biotin synthase